MGIIAYKGFESDLSCRGFQYEIGKTYKLPETENPVLCNRGFHASPSLLNTFVFYIPIAIPMGQHICRSSNRYCEVELDGFCLTSFFYQYPDILSDDKFCASQITIKRELRDEEIEDAIESCLPLPALWFEMKNAKPIYYKELTKDKYFKKDESNGLWYECNSLCDKAISSDDFWRIMTSNETIILR